MPGVKGRSGAPGKSRKPGAGRKRHLAQPTIVRLHRTESFYHAIAYLRSRISELEATSFAAWPQWSGEDLEAVERVISEFNFSE
jgi:hypothetical protein